MKLQENLSKAQRKEQKRKNRELKQQRLADKNKAPTQNIPADVPLKVLCVKFGNKYGIDYVEKLRNMVSRHLTIDYEFVCLTDEPKPIEGVRTIYQRNAGYTRGWWHKVHMFDPDLPLSGRILYFDLDVIIHKNIDKIAQHRSDTFLGIRDFNRKFHPNWKNLNSSVLAWNFGTQNHLWETFKNGSAKAMRLHGDQDYIWKETKGSIKFFPDNWIQSYKWEIRSKQELVVNKGKRIFRNIDNNVKIHPECCVAVFHGEPNPESIGDKFVVDNWN